MEKFFKTCEWLRNEILEIVNKFKKRREK